MFGSRNRDFKTEARAIDRRMEKHSELTNQYIAEGMDKDEASKKALNEVIKLGITGVKSKQICIDGKMF